MALSGRKASRKRGFGCWRYIGLAVIALGVSPELGDEFGDRQRGVLGWKRTPACEPFADQAVVGVSADLGAIFPQVVIPAVQGDDGLTGSPVETACGRFRSSGHKYDLQK